MTTALQMTNTTLVPSSPKDMVQNHSLTAILTASSDKVTILPPISPHRHQRSFTPVVSSPLRPPSPTTIPSVSPLSPSASVRSTRSASRVGGRTHPVSPLLGRATSLNALTTRPPQSPYEHNGPDIPDRSQMSTTQAHALRRHRARPSSPSQSSLAFKHSSQDYSRYPTRAARGPSSRAAGVRPDRPKQPRRSSRKKEPVLRSRFSFEDDRDYEPDPRRTSMDLPLYVNQDDFVDDAHGSDSLESGKTGRKGVKGCYRMGSICSMAGLMVTILGLIGIFVILPVLTYIGVANTGSKATLVSTDPDHLITDQVYPLLRHRGLIDPTTPRSALSRRGVDGDMLELVFSDEFSEDGRTFYEGDDAFWTAPDLWYGATRDLEWYSPDAVTTKSGTLRLQMDQFANHNLSFRSGMLNSWNQLCMKGGALEVSVSLPGPASTPGLWGGVWTLGNLGRPGYRASTEGVWPYTYGECDAGITPNQSSPDGISRLPGQRLPACTCAGEEHPNPGMGRGAPEIDVLEAGADPRNRLGLVTQSYQVAPFDIWYRPNYDYMAFPDNEMTELNDYCGGPFQQAISGTTTLNPKWYDDEEYQRYGFEYSASPSDGQIAWFVGDVMSFKMHGNATGPNGNVGRRSISQEPMAMVLNLGMSEGWSEIDYANLKFPTIMYIDYVRWYQKAGESSVTCDPPGYPTTEYIQQHPLAYTNSNLTTWDETGYGWPKHELNGGC